MRLSDINKNQRLSEYGMKPGEPTPVTQQQSAASAKSRSATQKPGASPSTAPSSSPSSAQSDSPSTQDTDQQQEPESLVVKADQLEKDAVFPSGKGDPVKVISPANSTDPAIPDDAADAVIVHDERTGKYYALDPESKVAIPQVEESVFDRFDNLPLAEQLIIMSEMTHSTINEAWSKKYKDSINCSNPKGFSQKAHCAGKKKKKKTSETIEAAQDMAALLTAYGTPGKRKRKKSKKEAVGESVPNNDAEYKLRQVMSKPLLTSDIESQMAAYIALPDPDMLLQFRLRRAEGGDNVDLRPVVREYMKKLHPGVKQRFQQD